MGNDAALFLFLSAAVIAVFAFLSIAAWASIPARERWERDRMLLLKSIAEQPGENAIRVLEWLKEKDRIKEQKEAAEKRSGLLMSGCFMIPIGLVLYKATGIMGLIPLSIGVVLAAFGIAAILQARSGRTPNLH